MSVSVIGRKVGNSVIVHGTWTHTEGGAAETVTVAGTVLSAQFTHCDSSGRRDVLVPFSVSKNTTTGVSTITFYPNATVTDGRFVIFTT